MQIARRDQPPDAAGGDSRAARDARYIRLHAKSKLASQFRQSRNVGLGLVAKPKRLAFMHLDGVQRIAQHAPGKMPRRPVAQLVGEGKYQHLVQPRLRQQPQFFFERRNQRQS